MVARQAALSMGFPRQEYWSGLLFPPPGALPHLGIRLVSLESLVQWQADSSPLRHLDNPRNHGRSSGVSHSVVSGSLQPHGLLPTGLLCPWDFPGKNTGVGCHALLQGIFPTQGLNPGLLHCRQTLWSEPPGKSPELWDVVLILGNVFLCSQILEAMNTYILLRILISAIVFSLV